MQSTATALQQTVDISDIDLFYQKVDSVFQKQKDFFRSGRTLDIPFRKQQLKNFKAAVKKHEREMYDAIYKDFNKSEFDTFVSEIGLLYNEIDLFLRKTASWSRKKRVSTNLTNIPGSSYIVSEPYGNCFIIGAWNYPYNLTLMPLVACIATGNTAILKPSGTSKNAANVIIKIINETFPEEYIYAIGGRGSIVERVMDNPFDKVFFTGSPRAGKEIMRKAADHLTSVSLELGGKSPCLFTEDAMNDVAFQRLAWGKFFNAGQTCVAPDYVLVPENAKDKFLEGFKKGIEKVVGGDHKKSDFYCQVITERHIKRFQDLVPPEKVYYGGDFDIENRYLSPTILHNVTLDDAIMQDEIFGPIMPVLTYKDLDEAIAIIRKFPKPLSFHYYTKQGKVKDRLIREVPSGSGGVNDSLVFMANHHLPFGGVGNSGMGQYHGKFGFAEFSNQKGVLERPLWFEPPLKYLPYKGWKKDIISFFSKF